MITTQVEINASPETVRKVLLDFPIVSKWHKGLIKSITPLDTSDPLAIGKKLHCEMEDFEFDSIITENSPNKFAWQGPPVMIVSGLHSFLIEPSKSNPGGTTFTQTEVYSGGVSFLMQPWLMGKPIKGWFEKYNTDLKKKCEGL
ncbi:12bea38f-6b97-4f48-abdd-6a0ca8cc8466 [Sclerotinia trifoliorum]|uniref:12bea38f-6b97-4f48-abdd-6a0ca8cc8466 n=1 Tax=Sclerotinia trifoliorum TaxID=28548 RepID=A0A8H2ZLT2_9HELO|nr:12bea38f-6b97-4f48-abdd-6a0ca8cc8466 [Sclerotinia trifoliorum]